MNDEPAPLASLAPDVPPAVAELVTRALRKDPAERFSAMEHVANLLEPALGPTSKQLPYPLATTNPMLPYQRTVTTGDASYAPPRSPPAKPRPPRRAPIAILAGVAGIVAVASGLAAHRSAPPSAANAAPLASAKAMLPSNATAASTYAMALEALHEGMSHAAVDLLKKVIALEPSFAPAVFRLALLDYDSNQSLKDARDLLQRATVMRGSLSDPDAALLDALSPCILQYAMAHGECEERLDDAVRRFPGDLDILRELAAQQMFGDKIEATIATCRSALSKEPTYVHFDAVMGEMQAYAGRFEEAEQTLTRCTQMRPEATGCIDNRIAVHVQRDECTAVESDARDWMSAAPRDGGRWGPHHYLAEAQIALGRAREAVTETLALEWSKTPEEERAAAEAADRATLAALEGDFGTAETQLAALEKQAVGDDLEDTHALPASLRVQLYEEEGRLAEAADVADAFLRRRESWTRDTREDDWEIAQDVSMRMNDALRRAGRIAPAEFVARRERVAGALGADARGAVRLVSGLRLLGITSGAEAREALAEGPGRGAPAVPAVRLSGSGDRAGARVGRRLDAGDDPAPPPRGEAALLRARRPVHDRPFAALARRSARGRGRRARRLRSVRLRDRALGRREAAVGERRRGGAPEHGAALQGLNARPSS